MTDNEIIKALECHVGKMDCDSCPYGAEHGVYCIKVLHRHSLEIITRQKAEIEALKLINSTYVATTNEIREIAIKELAKRLKENFPGIVIFHAHEARAIIDDLVKEMVGERE